MILAINGTVNGNNTYNDAEYWDWGYSFNCWKRQSKEKLFQWFGHVMRMEKIRILRRALFIREKEHDKEQDEGLTSRGYLNKESRMEEEQVWRDSLRFEGGEG